jgi:hypothetical protein
MQVCPDVAAGVVRPSVGAGRVVHRTQTDDGAGRLVIDKRQLIARWRHTRGRELCPTARRRVARPDGVGSAETGATEAANLLADPRVVRRVVVVLHLRADFQRKRTGTLKLRPWSRGRTEPACERIGAHAYPGEHNHREDKNEDPEPRPEPAHDTAKAPSPKKQRHRPSTSPDPARSITWRRAITFMLSIGRQGATIK